MSKTIYEIEVIKDYEVEAESADEAIKIAEQKFVKDDGTISSINCSKKI